jgi:4-amino-4-deoxy-L-arabinose transferase-like glycosyltransferase
METEPNHSPADPAGERLRAADVGFLLLAASPFLWNLGALSLWYAEERWLFIVRHMRESGDWLSLVKDGEFYGDKPYFSYWAQAASAALWGGLTEASARFPSALAGIGTVLTTAWIAARTLGRSRARAAGLVLATSFSFAMFSRLATADLWNTFFSTAAIAAYLAIRESPTILRFVGLGICLGLGGQSKGIPAIVLPVAVAACDLLGLGFARRRERPWRVFPWLRAALGAAIALAVFVGIYVGPFALAYARTGNWSALELVWRENFVRVLDAFDHRDEGPLFYCYILPAMMAPWTLWVPMAIAFGASRWNRHEGWRFLGLAFAVIFAMFTVSESRRSYYILPAFPWAAILTAGFLHECWEGAEAGAGGVARAWRLLARIPAWILFLASGVGAFLLVFGGFVPSLHEAAGPLIPSLVAFGFAFAAAAIVLGRGLLGVGDRLVAAGIFGIAWLVLGLNVTIVDALRSRSIVERGFASELRAKYPSEEFTFFSMARGLPARYYLGDGPLAKDADALASELERRGGTPILVIVEARFFEKLRSRPDLAVEIVERATAPGFGELSQAKDKLYLVRCARRG